MDALWANELTSLCSPAELLELTEAARRIARECGVKPLAAMITDIPGFTWSLVTTLARSGVRYLSVGPNRGHRTGRMTARLGDRPFWWVSPSGEERVLCWVHGEGYSLFHTRMYAESIENRLDEATVLPVLERLADASYPHQTVVLRYTVGSDNGPPHEAMPDVVRDWNERYVTPRLVISTVSEAFGALEAEAGSRLPEMRGDLTAYWEDGAASTALETAMNRASAERLAQAEAACLIVRADACAAADLSEEFRSGWRKVLLFDEHTWGSWNSISEPDAELTREQWAVKRSYALSADATSRRLLSLALAPRVTGPSDASAVEVVNTECRPRTDLVRLSRESAPACANARLIDEAGNEVPSQVLSTGELAFVARDVPPLGSRVYRFAPNGDAAAEARARAVPSPFSVSEDGIESGEFAVAVDLGDGSVRSAVWKRGGAELVDGSAAHGLNGYLYVAGRDPASAVPAGRASVVMGESGPVVASLLVSGPAAGCERLTREVVLVAGLDRIELVNTLDKTGVRTPEAVHFAFPMNVPDGTVRYDLAFGACRAETDQLPGGNRNHLTVAYAADVSNGEFGVTLACPDAPLIEVGALRADPIVVGWLDRLEPSSLLFGYAMSNYWETNYRAEQPGRVSVRYVVGPHGRPSGAAMRRFGVAARRPLLAVPTSAGQAPLAGLPCPGGDGVEVVAMRPMNGSVLMTLHNAGRDRVAVEWLRPPGRVRLCDLDGLDPVELRGTLVLPPFAVRSVLVDRRADPA